VSAKDTVDVYDSEDVTVALGTPITAKTIGASSETITLTAHDLKLEGSDKDRDDRKGRAGKHEGE
jgi:hypothetical protein